MGKTKTEHGFIENGTYYKKEYEKMKLRMGGGSWTIPTNEIKNHDIERIRYKTEANVYEIDLEDAWCSGWEGNFKGEDKLVVPIKNWTITRRNN